MTSPQHSSWRDVLKIHPAAELFPLMSPDELRALGEDIKKNGLTAPIAITGDGRLLDGRNRLDAIEMAMGCLRITDWHGILRIEDSTHLQFDAEEVEGDPYAYVISANIHRRHLSLEQKRELIAKLIKATPGKSNRQIAETVKASPTTVGTVRTEMEAKGEVSKLDTRTDAKGVKQPATKPARRPTHVCWQCHRRGTIGEVQEHRYAQYGDEDVWLHDTCVSAFDQDEQQRNQQREAAAERIRALMGGKTEPPDDIGPASTGEVARLQARVDELQAEKHRLEMENVGLKSEVEEARAAPPPVGNEPLTVLIELLGQIIGNANQAAWLRPFTARKQKQAGKLIERLRGNLYELVELRQAVRILEGKPETIPPPADDGLDIPAGLRRAVP